MLLFYKFVTMTKKRAVLFGIDMKAGRIIFKLFSVFPWASVRLEDVEYFRISSAAEYFKCLRNGDRVIFWPMFIWGHKKRMTPIYVLKSAGAGRKFFFRARSGYHYTIRTAIGNARAGSGRKPPMPW